MKINPRQRVIPAFYPRAGRVDPPKRVVEQRGNKDLPIWHVRVGKVTGFYRSKNAKPGPCVCYVPV